VSSDHRLHEQRWHRAARALPGPVRRLLETVDVPWLRAETLEEIESEIFGWEERQTSTREGRTVRLDQAGVRSSWSGLLNAHLAETMSTVRRIVDENKRAAHFTRVQGRDVGGQLLPQHRNPTAKEGVLTLTPPPHRRTPYFGVSSYLEATPVEVPVYVARSWQRRTRGTNPKVWDLTAGSCTVAEVLRTDCGAVVVSSDLVGSDVLDARADLRDAGRIPQHRGPRQRSENHGQSLVVETPDLVFLDPPGRGLPTHASLYLGLRPELDFALLDRNDYLGEVLGAVVDASTRLASGGLVSVLLREGVRADQRVTVDPTLVAEFVDAAAEFPELDLVDRVVLHEPAPVRQASLASTRYPMTHLLFARAS
jgi:hypothetical protein